MSIVFYLKDDDFDESSSGLDVEENGFVEIVFCIFLMIFSSFNVLKSFETLLSIFFLILFKLKQLLVCTLLFSVAI